MILNTIWDDSYYDWEAWISKLIRPKFKSSSSHFLDVWLGSIDFSSQSFCFLIYKMEMIIR